MEAFFLLAVVIASLGLMVVVLAAGARSSAISQAEEKLRERED